MFERGVRKQAGTQLLAGTPAAGLAGVRGRITWSACWRSHAPTAPKTGRPCLLVGARLPLQRPARSRPAGAGAAGWRGGLAGRRQARAPA